MQSSRAVEVILASSWLMVLFDGITVNECLAESLMAGGLRKK